jgi:hypothetical protein
MADASDNISAYLKGSAPRVSQQVLEVLTAGDANAVITQLVVEALYEPSSLSARLTQLVLETLYEPDSLNARLTQLVVEVLYKPDSVSSISAFLEGANEATDSISAYLTGPILVSDSVPVYLDGEAQSFDNQPAYLKGQDSALDSTSAFLKGLSTLQTDSVSAYTKGSSDVSDSVFAYTEGFQDSASDSISAYLDGLGEILYPDSDISQSGSWKREDAVTTNLYVSIDEQPGPNDADYVWHDDASVSDYFEVALSDPQYIQIDPGPVKVFWRARRRAGTQTMTIKMELREGVTVRASDSQTITDDDTTYVYELTSGEKSSISDWDNLRLRFTVESIT